LEDGLNARYKFAEGNRLGNVPIRASLEGPRFIGVAIADRQHQNGGSPGLLMNLPAGLDPAHAGHLDVEQDNVEMFSAQGCQSMLSRRGFRDLESKGRERSPEHATERRFIVHHQDFRFFNFHLYLIVNKPTHGKEYA
jgi:hypothetical protein